MLGSLYAIAHMSVRTSVCHTGGSAKTVEARIIKIFSPYGSPIRLVFAG